jgi:UDP-N-acetylglucosamine 2-epimerase (non-hydrolysing)
MLLVIIGTRAQLIKTAPVLRELEQREVPYRLILTGQHKATMEDLLAEFGIRTGPAYLYQGDEISSVLAAPAWFLRCLFRYFRTRKELLGTSSVEHTVVIHGDTFSTLLGAILGKCTGARVLHIESGLRSHNLLHPFPEELVRLLAFRLLDVAFCPGHEAWINMEKYRSIRIDTGHNTIVDALKLILVSDETGSASDAGAEHYAVCTIHRFENIYNRSRFAAIIGIIEEIAGHIPIRFILHPATDRQLRSLGFRKSLEDNENIMLLPRMGYADFIRLASRAAFVISDGGSNQEELSYLGIPTLVMRRHTERPEGLDRTALLCPYDKDVALDFVNNLDTYRKENLLAGITPSPSAVIAEYIQERT